MPDLLACVLSVINQSTQTLLDCARLRVRIIISIISVFNLNFICEIGN